ncbi:hypothetical protein [uncultured Microbacterium sp.]|uniref:hypothetical protein n=1 Tax=uncultured Microbacterium sp. TaxID=191216 RepID=UPI0025F3E198|nr:hypothetical protein [uncultured Microbacterium sp.]
MIGFVFIEQMRPPKRPWRNRLQRPNPRAIARAVVMLQRAEGMMLHAKRDACGGCAAISATCRDIFAPLIPSRLMKDPEWVHRHIEAPGIRIQTRLEDRMAGS